MWRRGGRVKSISGKTIVACVNDQCTKVRFPAEELLFICGGRNNCPASRPNHEGHREYFQNQRSEYRDAVLFHPARFRYEVDCPYCNHKAYLKVCPHCGARQPVSLGDASTIAVIGSSSSGKTCYLTSLIRQINRELSKEVMYGMSLEWRDDDGRKYFRDLQKLIFEQGLLPPPNQKQLKMKTLDITIRFPVHGWRRTIHVRHGVVPLVFPDPSGEMFDDLKDAYLLSCLAQAQQILLMINPFSSQQYRVKREAKGMSQVYVKVDDPTDALNAFINAIRDETRLSHGAIPKDLAVVVTKCDEEGVFDPDDAAYAIARQSGRYRPELAAEISTRVAQHMEMELGMAEVVAQARANFRTVSFFAATALGKPPVQELVQAARGDTQQVQQKVENAQPRRVEEPFLWTLHRRGYF
jgi:hypothetical protein